MTEPISPSKMTPWGQPDSVEQIAEGITFYSTPSHGGFHLSPERMQEMPEHLRRCSYTGDAFFEEDCSFCAVILSFPEFFPEEDRKVAQFTYDAVYAGKVEQVQSVVASADQGRTV
jgi:hypothetical protein